MMSRNSLDGSTYTLFVYNQEKRNVQIGKLGRTNFVKGYYIYLGSAKNNLWAQIKRHLTNNKKKFWHIDYLLLSCGVNIREIWISSKEQECQMTKQFFEKGLPYIHKFGSSDCLCKSHLFYIDKTFSDNNNHNRAKKFLSRQLIYIRNLLKMNGFRNVYKVSN